MMLMMMMTRSFVDFIKVSTDNLQCIKSLYLQVSIHLILIIAISLQRFYGNKAFTKFASEIFILKYPIVKE